ncbi:ABC transporter, ATP-binding/permease protein [Streptococcus sp. DD12]|nr:ABC transporter, ATP-binding/permease protein [Streptococcus sp. DD12]
MAIKEATKRLLGYVSRYKVLSALALIFLLVTTIIQTVIPLVAEYFIDHMISHVGQKEAIFLLGYYVLYLLEMVTSFVGNLLFARVAYSVVRDMRQDAFATIEKLGMSYYDQTAAGAIVSRITNDTETVSDMFSGVLSTFVSAIFIFQ